MQPLLSRRLLCALAVAAPALVPAVAHAQEDRFFDTSDGVRLHYIEAGRGFTIVLVPGWTMPAWIWDRQIAFFSRAYRVVAFDPRGQGLSEVSSTGYEPGRRGQDIAELIDHLGGGPVLLVGWSLGVLDSLAYVHTHGDTRLAGLVLVDNSVGENPPPMPHRGAPHHRRLPYEMRMASFVRSMFHHSPGEAYLERLTEAALHTPEAASERLLAYPVPRTYWREAIYATEKPVLYVVRPGLSGQAGNLAAHRPNTECVVFRDAGHALFIDDADRFNSVMLRFIRQYVWP